jgi:hypothetical protein
METMDEQHSYWFADCPRLQPLVSMGRARLALRGREFPLGQFLVWLLFQAGFVLGVALPYWAQYETTSATFRNFGVGLLSIEHGLCQVCVSGVGSGCFPWSRMADIDPSEYGGGGW